MAIRSLQTLAAAALLILTTSAASTLTGCAALHVHTVNPTYDANAVRAASSSTPICTRGEAVSVAVTDNTPIAGERGNNVPQQYRFTRDPALVYQQALEESLKKSGCQSNGSTGEPAALALQVNIGRLVARGDPCLGVSCDGRGEVRMMVTLADAKGKALINKSIFSETTRSCGAQMCSDEEAAELAKAVITDSVAQTMAQLADPMTRELAGTFQSPSPRD